MSSHLAQLQEATIKQHCKTLRMPMMASQFSTLAEQAVREKKTHTGYLEVLLTAEIEERERNTIERRIKEAHLPRVKTLDSTTRRRRWSARRRCATSPRAVTSSEPNQFCSSAIAGLARRIF